MVEVTEELEDIVEEFGDLEELERLVREAEKNSDEMLKNVRLSALFTVVDQPYFPSLLIYIFDDIITFT